MQRRQYESHFGFKHTAPLHQCRILPRVTEWGPVKINRQAKPAESDIRQGTHCGIPTKNASFCPITFKPGLKVAGLRETPLCSLAALLFLRSLHGARGQDPNPTHTPPQPTPTPRGRGPCLGAYFAGPAHQHNPVKPTCWGLRGARSETFRGRPRQSRPRDPGRRLGCRHCHSADSRAAAQPPILSPQRAARKRSRGR